MAKVWGIVPAIRFIPLITKTSKNCRLLREGERMPFMKRVCDDDGLCMISLLTLPGVVLPHSTPSHPPQQSAPVHVERIPVVSSKMVALKLRRAALSALEQIDDGILVWDEVVMNVVIKKILSANLRNCILRCGIQ